MTLGMVSYLRRCIHRSIQIIGLIATGWFVWATLVSTRIRRAPLDLLIGRALLHILVACACAAAIGLCVYLTVWWTSPGRVRYPLGFIAAATWYAPAFILGFAG